MKDVIYAKIDPDIRKKVSVYAVEHGIHMNQVVEKALREYLVKYNE